ncbi:hypothetical protein MTR_4g080245 [Medicago truncatula]|uniref:Uncharacterized protein n=1 Tax=Medicago truncatula TaxID=3880 RepID=A0A072UMX9_MEDTR|nr:hypothetical protein MTR_4g080245 [Medicago truncatula]
MKLKRLAKSKTRKGGLGKNEHPAGLTTRKGSSGKNGALKRTYFPGGSKTRKGDPGKNGMKKMMNENENITCKSIDHRCNVYNIPSAEMPSTTAFSPGMSPQRLNDKAFQGMSPQQFPNHERTPLVYINIQLNYDNNNIGDDNDRA